MAKKVSKAVERIWNIFEKTDNTTRQQWQYINQKGFDFSNDNQLTEAERVNLEEQGMPTFTINRILPVVEMLNFYATANRPRWQAVAAEGSDTDVAAVFSDIADYIWYLSDASSLYGNAINDAITKSVGYLMVTVDTDSDQGMGDVRITQPEPFDVFVDPKARDILFRDAAFIIIRKVLPKLHLISLFPDSESTIKKASSKDDSDDNYSEKSTGPLQKDWGYKDVNDEAVGLDGEHDDLVDYYELYEKVKIPFINVFYKVDPPPEVMEQIQAQAQEQIAKAQQEFEVQVLERQKQFEEAVQAGEMLPERAQLEMQKFQEGIQMQLQQMQEQTVNTLKQANSQIKNDIVSEKEMKTLRKVKDFAKRIINEVKFYQDRVKYTCVVGDKIIKEKVLPEKIKDYPIIPFHFKWTGTPFPISAVSPLIGKQMELNKAHQIMVHNASLGSSLRWMHEEGSIDTDHWERYSSSPGALLPIRPGSQPPTPVQPMPLSNAFFGIVQEGKGDMEYLAGIYSSMMGDTSSQHETYRGMLAMDEYGTRRIRQWLRSSIEPGLKHMGKIIAQFSQSVYTAQKVFRIVQPNNIKEDKEVKINVPIYNDLGEAIGKFHDYATGQFDVRVVSGSTMPVNRWAYLDELKQLLQMGVVDDIAVLAETDIRNKERIAQRKSMYSQMQGQMQQMEESLKDKEGTIETLERQLVQAGIKGKVMQAEMEINKKKEEVKGEMKDAGRQTAAEQKLLRKTMVSDAAVSRVKMAMQQENSRNKADNAIEDLSREKKELEREKKNLDKNEKES
jgi:hypothetical protein